MHETDYREIKKRIKQKKKQGMDEKEIIKFLELSGYPLRLLEEVNREYKKKESKENKGEEINPLAVKTAGTLLFLTWIVEIFYFFLLFPELEIIKAEHLFEFLLLGLFGLISLILGIAVYKRKYQGHNYASILILLRIFLLGYFVILNHAFFLYIIFLDVVLAFVFFLIKPFFADQKKTDEREKLMNEIEMHKQGKDKKELWEK